MSEDPIILNYYDCVLRQSDVRLLDGTHWLNDQLISFYFEYLTKEKCQDRKNVLFISPEVVHCLKSACEEELAIFLEPLEAKRMELIICAINNCSLVDGGGGSHWSLLAFIRSKKKFCHFDSIKGTNVRQACQVSVKLVKFLCPQQSLDFQEVDCIQQKNSYDCGLFTMLFAEAFADTCDYDKAVNVCRTLDCRQLTQKRREILDLIQGKAVMNP